MRRLVEYPEQRAFLRSDPSSIPEAFRGVLRYDRPTQFLCRTVVSETEVGGKKFKPGQGVLFLYASANRDEREFPNPTSFDVRRKPDWEVDWPRSERLRTESVHGFAKLAVNFKPS
jgi:cytochrome P450